MNSPQKFEQASPARPIELPRRRQRFDVAAAIRRYMGFIAIVILPTTITAVYIFGVASNQYVSEAHFTVRSGQQATMSTPGIGQLFGLGGAVQSQNESYSVVDYLQSQDAVTEADRRLNLVGLFQRPEADPISRLWQQHPEAETLTSYYRRHVNVTFNPDTGETTLMVRAFRRQDAKNLAEALLELGEARVNQMNQRAQDDTLRVSRNELAASEAELALIQERMTRFRTTGRDIDPEKSSSAQLLLVSRLQDELAQATAQLSAMAPYVSHDSPQYVALASRTKALHGQIAVESGRLTASSGSLAPQLADYQSLQLRQDLAAKRYAAATTALLVAREQAIKQQLYVVRVVEPNLPQKALYPHRGTILLSVFLCGMLIYGIGWLLVAGVREHAA